MKKTGERSFRALPPVPAIKIGGRAQNAATRYSLILVVFMRVVAVLWIVEGLAQWLGVLTDDTGMVVASASARSVTAILFFCILDLIAAVGLWLATPWGGVVWIATILGQVLSLFALPGFLPYPDIFMAADVVLVSLYLTLTWLAAREASVEGRR